MRPTLVLFVLFSAACWLPAGTARAAARVIDLATVPTAEGGMQRIFGSAGAGQFGVPVAGGADCDGDGHADTAFAALLASPAGRELAGEAYLIFGDGTTRGEVDTAVPQERVLRLIGAGPQEAAGAEVWIDDVTGDGLGDLIVGRPNFSAPGRIGAGAVTVVPGGAALRRFAAGLRPLDLGAPPANLAVTTLTGRQPLGRLGIWARTGDVTGDGVADLLIGADQEGEGAAGDSFHHGAVYLIRGGAHLASGTSADLGRTAGTALQGHTARIEPPPGATEHHLGGTCQLADLDGNGRAEVLAAATLNRASAALPAAGALPGSAHSAGGAPAGELYIAWDDNFPAAAPWPTDFRFSLSQAPGAVTRISGTSAAGTVSFGEEILGGLDYDGDGQAELFVGDLVADGTAARNRPVSGMGFVFYRAAALKGLRFPVSAPPPGVALVRLLGPNVGALAADTAIHGDFDGDGLADLALSSPHGAPPGRTSAGIFHVLWGRPEVWPALIDLAAPPAGLALTDLWGARGQEVNDLGDTLGYSAASGDLNGDGLPELLINEMLGNGRAPAARDVGNLLLVSSALLTRGLPCQPGPEALCLGGGRFRVRADWITPQGTGPGRAVPLTGDSGYFWFFSPENVELLAKTVDGCGLNQRRWIFSAGLTNVGVRLAVTDTQTGAVRSYLNPQGRAYPPIFDTDAFTGCTP